METTKILWSGLTGRTGFEAIKAAREMSDVDIVMGMTRRDMDGILAVNGEKFDGVDWLKYDLDMFGPHGLFYLVGRAAIDVIVDFSHPDAFDKVLELAICTGKPLISGTAGLSEKQMMALRCTTSHIPIFRGGNFRFKVKKFIDEAVKLAMTTSGPLTLYENFYKGKTLPSETSRVVQHRILRLLAKGLASVLRRGLAGRIWFAIGELATCIVGRSALTSWHTTCWRLLK